ncbi:MAG: Uma2 family endonuclease [Clostridiales bacterium]|nr:Uma2 family endonuclease [Clostridiales bacterium]
MNDNRRLEMSKTQEGQKDMNPQKNMDLQKNVNSQKDQISAVYQRTEEISAEDVLGEAALQYAVHSYDRQGEYTLEDYYALPDEQRVELIDGVFYDMAAPYTTHQIAGFEISMQLGNFIKSQKGKCRVMYAPVDVQLDCDDKTMLQPDVLVVCDMGKIHKRCVYGAPDFVIEILSDSTARKDRTVKLRKYLNAGVREYWLVDLEQEKVIVYDATGETRADVNEAGANSTDRNEIDGNRTGMSCRTFIYGMEQPVPVQIFGGTCQIYFDEICEAVRPILQQN